MIFVDGLGVFGVGESLAKARIVSELADTFADIASSICDYFDIENILNGNTFIKDIIEK